MAHERPPLAHQQAQRRHASKMVRVPLPWGMSRTVPAGWIIVGFFSAGIAMRVFRSEPAAEPPPPAE